MSKKFHELGSQPCNVWLIGDTKDDPRARVAIEAAATAVARFRIVSRDLAIRGGAQQSGNHTTLPNGIQLRYQFNNGLERVLAYVPLTNPQPVPVPKPEQPTNSILVLDVLFPCAPYMVLQQYDGPHWTLFTAKARHAALWASGVTLTNRDHSVVDITSKTPFGASAGGNDTIAVAEILPTGVTEGSTLSDFTLAHSEDEFTDLSGSSWLNPYQGPSSIDNIYRGYYGTSYLVRPQDTSPVKFKVYMLHSNMVENSTYNESIPGYVNTYDYHTTYAPIILQGREYLKTSKLKRYTVNTIEQIYTITGEPTGGDEGVADIVTRSYDDVYTQTWHFIANDKFEQGTGAPCDPTQKGMGKLIYSGSGDATLAYTLARDDSHINGGGPGYPVKGFSIWNASYDYGTLIGQPATTVYDDFPYTGDAASMVLLATVTYSPPAPGEQQGKLAVTYNYG